MRARASGPVRLRGLADARRLHTHKPDLRIWSRSMRCPWRFAMNIGVRFSMLLTLLCGPAFAAMTLSSTDFASGDTLPTAHIYPRCGGRNISPQLSWSGVPSAARSLVLTMIDVDVKASQWSHWIVVDLPADANSLSQGAASLPGRATAVVNNSAMQPMMVRVHPRARARITTSSRSGQCRQRRLP
jgi:hypothetical protein